MASVQECEAALTGLAGKLAGLDAGTRRKHAVDRVISCTISDLAVTFRGRLTGEGLSDIVTLDAPARDAQIKLTVGSDDLLALTDGRLGFAGAWASGRLKVDASVLDILKLRSLL